MKTREETGTQAERWDKYAAALVEDLTKKDGLDENDPVRWKKSWVMLGRHQNIENGRIYQGGNIFRTMLHNMAYGTKSCYWIGKQSAFNNKKLKVPKGTEACPIYVPMIKDKDKDDETPTFFFNVAWIFNADSIEGLEIPEPELNPLSLDDACTKLEGDILKVGADVKFSESTNTPHYSPSKDKIGMPTRDQFHKQEEYCSTLAHEHVHWTGHEKRLNRQGITEGGRSNLPVYAFEELVAEIGASFMCQLPEYGIAADKLQHIEYLSSWITLLKDKPRAIFEAAELAQKAVSYLKPKENAND